ncbi:hypothetical protein BC829DRAFT_400067 [Chytridium lagenaria]|nr:hypothetical protein BC829DRAFT_400067 [Chytridium lagenaria]
MTNADLFGYMVAATSGNVAILIIWSIFDPPTPVVISRGNSDGMNFIYCGSKSAAVQSGFTPHRDFSNTVNTYTVVQISVAATVFSVSLFLPILYFLTNDVSAMYVIKSFYSIFRNRQQQAAGVPTQSQKNSMISSQTAGPTVDKNGKMAINSAYLQLLKTSASTLVANCVYPTKKVGVVFWNSKIAVLQPEQRLLFILSPDAAAPPKVKPSKIFAIDSWPPPVPETLVFPLTKFSVSTPESGGGSNHLSSTTTANSATSNSQSQSQSQQDGVAAASNATPIVTVTNNDTGHSVTLQFESTQVKKEWQTLLNQLADGKYIPRFDVKSNVMATAKIDV